MSSASIHTAPGGVIEFTAESSNAVLAKIEIDARGETSQPGIFAAGDCTTVPYKQIVIAMGAGSTAALSAFDYLIRLPAAEQQAQAA